MQCRHFEAHAVGIFAGQARDALGGFLVTQVSTMPIFWKELPPAAGPLGQELQEMNPTGGEPASAHRIFQLHPIPPQVLGFIQGAVGDQHQGFEVQRWMGDHTADADGG